MKMLRPMVVALAAVGLVLLPAATATPDPTSVTIAGSLQSEAGCGGDWNPGCGATHLTYDADDDVWQGSFVLPADSYEYKAAFNDSWDENYGLHAVFNGGNIPTTVAPAGSVKFYYDHKTHWATDNKSAVIATAAGSFQSELGCTGDWQPDCLRSWLEDPDGNGIYSFETTALPAGSYETKVDDQRGLGRELRPRRRLRTGPTSRSRSRSTTQRSRSRYDARHARAHGHGREPERRPDGPGALSHFDLARKDCLGTARNTTSKVWFTVANGVLSDAYYPTVDNTNVETLQYVVTRRLDVHRSPDARHDLRRSRRCRTAAGWRARSRRRRRAASTGSRPTYLTDPDPQHGGDAGRVQAKAEAQAEGSRPAPVRPLRPDGERQRRRWGRATAAPTRRWSTARPGTRCSSPPIRSRRRTPPNRDYAQPVYAALDGSFAEAESGFVGAASDGLVQLDAGARADADLPRRRGRQRRPDRAGRARQGDGQTELDARLRRDAGRGGRSGRGLRRLRASASSHDDYTQGLEGATTSR